MITSVNNINANIKVILDKKKYKAHCKTWLAKVVQVGRKLKNNYNIFK